VTGWGNAPTLAMEEGALLNGNLEMLHADVRERARGDTRRKSADV